MDCSEMGGFAGFQGIILVCRVKCSFIFDCQLMPRSRDLSSKSRSRSSYKRSKRYHRDSSGSDRDSRRRSKPDRVSREEPALSLPYSIAAKSYIKYHIVYDNVRIYHRKDEDIIMEEVKLVLEREFGRIREVDKLEGEENSFSFGVGFKYDVDALHFIKECGYINSAIDKEKLVAKATPIFQHCMFMLK